MFKVVFFLWRRDGSTRAQFRDHYEGGHTTLTVSDDTTEALVPEAGDYRRNYPVWGPNPPALFGPEPFDVMTEMWFPDRTGFEAQLETVTTSPGRERIAEDEAHFLRRDHQVLFVVDEFGNGASREVDAVKVLRIGRRAAGLDRAAFRERYEATAERPGLLGHRRNYPLFDHPLSFQGGHHNQQRPDESVFPIDLVEEFWLPAGAEAPTPDGALLDDAVTVRVDECRSPWGRLAAPLAHTHP
jgi:hypothetical protein